MGCHSNHKNVLFICFLVFGIDFRFRIEMNENKFETKMLEAKEPKKKILHKPWSHVYGVIEEKTITKRKKQP